MFLARAEGCVNAPTRDLRLVLAAIVSLGLFLLFRSVAGPVDNEFFNLYAGATIGPSHLYEPDRFAEFARSLHAAVIPARLYYTRMPYFAVLTKPLAWFAFPVALLIWRLIQAGAIAASVWCWPGLKTKLGVVALISVPSILVVWFAQDVGLVLFFASLSVALRNRKEPVAAGLVFSFCLAKPHLVIFLPLMMGIRREGRFLAGATLGAGFQLLLSFAVAPPDWPLRWRSILANPRMHPNSDVMPGLRHLAQSGPGSVLATLILASLVFAVWRAARSQPLPQAAAIALAAGLIGNIHSYAVDCILLLPLTAVALSSPSLIERLTGSFLASPFPVLALLLGYPVFLQASVLILVLLPALRRAEPAPSPPLPAGSVPPPALSAEFP
ncbi:MAG TPA: glycosyltransferase family 87 protein [Bryobacteraceae bacterium]|nr:glycosyltransferase family 87 protein [Bryobacteraceae bacterium]